MKSVLTSLAGLFIGVLAAIAALEAGLSALPVAKGLVRVSDESEWPLRNNWPNQPYTYSQGWDFNNVHRGRTNNYGHLAPFDYQPGSHPVVVIGDSFVQSEMNAYSDSTQAQLAVRLGEAQPVYGIGANGLSIADYLVAASQARPAFAPRALVFVLIDGDISQSLTPRQGWHHFRPENDGADNKAWQLKFNPQGLRDTLPNRILAMSSLYRYIRTNLSFETPDLAARFKNHHPAHKNAKREMSVFSGEETRKQASAARFFVDSLLEKSGVPPACIVMLLDSDRFALYGDSPAPAKDAPAAKQAFSDYATKAGIKVVDLAPRFEADYRAQQEKLDHWPHDRHWNQRGHAVAADATATTLEHCLGGAPMRKIQAVR